MELFYRIAMVSLTSCIILLLAFGHVGSLLLDSVLVSRRAANQNSLLAFHSQQQRSILKFKEADVNLDWDDNDEEENSDDDDDHLNSAQRSSVRRRYKLVSLVYASLGATLLFMPDKTLTKKLASKLGGAAGFGVAAGVSRMLLDATTEGRLHSPTTKRLNVGLLGFSFLGLLSVPGEAAFLPTAGPAMILTAIMTSARMLGVLAAYSGWSMGVIANQTNGSRITLMNPRRAATEIYGGAISSFKNLKVRQETKKTTLTYRNCLLLVSASMFSSLMEGLFYVRVSFTIFTMRWCFTYEGSADCVSSLVLTVSFSVCSTMDRALENHCLISVCNGQG